MIKYIYYSIYDQDVWTVLSLKCHLLNFNGLYEFDEVIELI